MWQTAPEVSHAGPVTGIAVLPPTKVRSSVASAVQLGLVFTVAGSDVRAWRMLPGQVVAPTPRRRCQCTWCPCSCCKATTFALQGRHDRDSNKGNHASANSATTNKGVTVSAGALVWAMCSIDVHQAAVVDMAVIYDAATGKALLVTAAVDCEVRAWDPTTGCLLWAQPGSKPRGHGREASTSRQLVFLRSAVKEGTFPSAKDVAVVSGDSCGVMVGWRADGSIAWRTDLAEMALKARSAITHPWWWAGSGDDTDVDADSTSITCAAQQCQQVLADPRRGLRLAIGTRAGGILYVVVANGETGTAYMIAGPQGQGGTSGGGSGGGLTNSVQALHATDQHIVAAYAQHGIRAWEAEGTVKFRELEGWLSSPQAKAVRVTHMVLHGIMLYACVADGSAIGVQLAASTKSAESDAGKPPSFQPRLGWHTPPSLLKRCRGLARVQGELFAATAFGVVSVDMKALSTLGVLSVHRCTRSPFH